MAEKTLHGDVVTDPSQRLVCQGVCNVEWVVSSPSTAVADVDLDEAILEPGVEGEVGPVLEEKRDFGY